MPVVLASKLLEDDLAKQSPIQVQRRIPWRTGIKPLDDQLTTSIWQGGKVIGIGADANESPSSFVR